MPPHPDPGSLLPKGLEIPDHQLLSRIARGSYGDVWLARNALGTFRAVKLIERCRFKDDQPFQRELRGIRKFEPISRSHPGFVNILQVGCHSDWFYYVMELGDDVKTGTAIDAVHYQVKTLEQALREKKLLPPAEVLWVGLRLSDALHHLHQNDLVHRDIKPANIIFVGGLPKLADIGLVTTPADANTLVGTLGYIPLDGPGTAQADVFALGKVLYECLTGLDRNTFPALPTLLDRVTDGDRFLEINEVIVKACHPNLPDRYRTARELHGDLAAIENGKSVRRLRELEHRWVRLRGAIPVAVLLLALGIIGALFAYRRGIERQRLAGMLSTLAIRAVDEGDLVSALRHTAQTIDMAAKDGSESIQRLRFGTIFGQLPKLTSFRSCSSLLTWCEFSPDDRWILATMADGRCEKINTESGVREAVFHIGTNGLTAGAISPDGNRIATASLGHAARIWSVQSGQVTLILPHPDMVTTIRFSPNGKMVATGCADGFVRLWRLDTGEMRGEIPAHTGWVESLTFAHASTFLVSGGRDKLLKFWRTDSLEPYQDPIKTRDLVLHASLCSDDSQLLMGSADKTAQLVSLSNPELPLLVLRHERGVRHVEFSPDEQQVLTASWDGTVRIWNRSNGRLTESILPQSSALACANFSHDGRRIVTACTDGSLKVWDLAGKTMPERVLAQAISANGRFVAFTNATGITIRETGGAFEQRVQAEHMEGVKKIFVSEDGKCVALIRNDRGIIRLQFKGVESASQWNEEIVIPMMPSRCRWGSKGAWILFREANMALLVNIHSGLIQSHTRAGLRDAALSPKDDCFALGFGQQVEIRSLADGKLVAPIIEHLRKVERLEFSPDGNRLLMGASDATFAACYAEIWDMKTGQSIGPRLWHHDGVKNVAWFQDGRRVVTASEDGTARVWDIHDGRQVGFDMMHKEELRGLDVSEDGHLILTTCNDKSVRLWDASTGLSIGPSIYFPGVPKSVKLLPSGRGFAVQETGGEIWLSHTETPAWDISALTQIARLLGNKLDDRHTESPFKSVDASVAEWLQLKAAYPQAFTVDNGEALAWHRFEAEHHWAHNRRDPELQHWRRVLDLKPDDTRASSRAKKLEAAGQPRADVTSPLK